MPVENQNYTKRNFMVSITKAPYHSVITPIEPKSMKDKVVAGKVMKSNTKVKSAAQKGRPVRQKISKHDLIPPGTVFDVSHITSDHQIIEERHARGWTLLSAGDKREGRTRQTSSRERPLSDTYTRLAQKHFRDCGEKENFIDVINDVARPGMVEAIVSRTTVLSPRIEDLPPVTWNKSQRFVSSSAAQVPESLSDVSSDNSDREAD
jgi:hypothetical protein